MTVFLLTSGDGFLGTYLAEALRLDGHEVRLLPALSHDPVHPATASDLDQVLIGVEVVVSLFGASPALPLTEILAAMTRQKITRLVLESSLEVYGEGLYADAKGRLFVPEPRSLADIEAGRWHLVDDQHCALTPLPTPETAEPKPFSAKGIAALIQERQALTWAESHETEIAILRLAALFGPPASGGAAPDDRIWRLLETALSGADLRIPEDGGQREDWLHVRDAAKAFRLAAGHCDRSTGPINIASGRGYSGDEIARLVAAAFRSDLPIKPDQCLDPDLSRHLVGSTDRARRLLGFSAEQPLENALGEMVMHLRDKGAYPSVGKEGKKER